MADITWQFKAFKGAEFRPQQEVQLDGIRFSECRFDGAVLIYLGGPPPKFENCSFSGVDLAFGGAAKDTIATLQWLISHKIIPGF